MNKKHEWDKTPKCDERIDETFYCKYLLIIIVRYHNTIYASAASGITSKL